MYLIKSIAPPHVVKKQPKKRLLKSTKKTEEKRTEVKTEAVLLVVAKNFQFITTTHCAIIVIQIKKRLTKR
jgi:hypothetical protein